MASRFMCCFTTGVDSSIARVGVKSGVHSLMSSNFYVSAHVPCIETFFILPQAHRQSCVQAQGGCSKRLPRGPETGMAEALRNLKQDKLSTAQVLQFACVFVILGLGRYAQLILWLRAFMQLLSPCSLFNLC